MLTIAIPKGRMLKDTLKLLKKAGIHFDKNIESSRRLIHDSIDKKFRAFLIRPKDVPTYVENRGTDIGIVGAELLFEESVDVYELLDLGFGYCRVVVAEPESPKKSIKNKDYLRIATKYPNITEKFFSCKGIQFEIIKLYGSIELAPYAGIADIIVDLVSSGATLKANKLTEVETILTSTARLIVNRISFKINNLEIIDFIKKIKNILKIPLNTGDET